MTFKHTNFEDSETMRSLVKLAKEKGLIKEDLLKKVASKRPKINLTPTDNLLENLMKLCNGLRESGMIKYAEELESVFINYKKASIECDDLVEEAHPKGSYKLEGVEGDAVIETIIDQHLKMLQMINKKPTGKLTNAKSIINSVKISLGNYSDEIKNNTSLISSNLSKAERLAINAGSMTEKEVGNINIITQGINDILVSINKKPTTSDIDTVISFIKQLFDIYSPAFSLSQSYESKLQMLIDPLYLFHSNKGITVPETWQNVKSLLNEANALCKKVKEIIIKLTFTAEVEKSVNSETDEFKNLRDTATKLINKLTSWKPTVSSYEDAKEVTIGINYINETIDELQLVINITNNPNSDDAAIQGAYSAYESIEKDMRKFYDGWIR